MKMIIAGTNTGCGKTTVSMALMAYLSEKGFRVSPFKVGPDYVDPRLHTMVTGNPGINLDAFLLSENTVKYLFGRRDSQTDISVIEGVMGMFDGHGQTTRASTAHIAKLVNAPVILTVNAEGMSHSIIPLIKGFLTYDEHVHIGGVILNKVNSKAHFEHLKQMIEENLGIHVIGYLPKDADYAIESRKLGLQTDFSPRVFQEKIGKLKQQIAENFDMALFMKLAETENDCTYDEITVKPVREHVKIAVTNDACFHFHYEDNWALLRECGAEIVKTSLLADKSLPDHVSGLIVCGGYPDSYAKELAGNAEMMQCVKNAVERGLPVYAESGGIAYFADSFVDSDRQAHKMLGALSGEILATQTLSKHFGYVDIHAEYDSILLQAGDAVKAHEFHYYNEHFNENMKSTFRIEKRKTGWVGGFSYKNLLASSQHLHFYTKPSMARSFVLECARFIGGER